MNICYTEKYIYYTAKYKLSMSIVLNSLIIKLMHQRIIKLTHAFDNK